MPQEIERKFKVLNNSYRDLSHKVDVIIQGYLTLDPERTVRVRKSSTKSTITIKGISTSDGLERYEFEKEITSKEADELLYMCVKTIRKMRYYVNYDCGDVSEYIYKKSNYGGPSMPTNLLLEEIDNMVWEIDEFTDSELILAEIEIPFSDFEVLTPEWIGEEVTGDIQYYNSNM